MKLFLTKPVMRPLTRKALIHSFTTIFLFTAHFSLSRRTVER